MEVRPWGEVSPWQPYCTTAHTGPYPPPPAAPRRHHPLSEPCQDKNYATHMKDCLNKKFQDKYVRRNLRPTLRPAVVPQTPTPPTPFPPIGAEVTTRRFPPRVPR